MQFDNEYYKLIIQKLVNEKDIWPKYRHLQAFTGGVSVCQRNEQIKSYLKSALKKRECTLNEVIKRMLQIELREFKLSNEFQRVSPKHEQVFKNAKYLNSVVKDHYTQYAFMRIKWNIARGFRYEIKEVHENYFLLQLKKSNLESRKAWQPISLKVRKYVIENNIKVGKCECDESLNSGFPCPHICLLNYKDHVDTLEIYPRWAKIRQDQGKKTQNKTPGH